MIEKIGFTLIELAIVLIIIGLIVGGVLVGKDLINAAGIRAQINQMDIYSIAFRNFELKYNCIPGDCAKATEFLTGTVNGNGNEIIERADGNGSIDNAFDGEQSHYFEQLSFANMIPGKFTTTATLGIGFPQISLNPATGFLAGRQILDDCSALKITNTKSWDCMALGKWRTGYFFVIGNPTGIMNQWNDYFGIFTPTNSLAIDTKIDDGMPHSGNLRSANPYLTSVGDCTTSDSPPGTYLLSNTQTSCHMALKLK